jgi:c-di-AMP phosphodiesterase-like protein
MAPTNAQNLKSLLDSARSVAILLPKAPTYDAVASALAFKLTLEQAGKSVLVAAPEPLTVEFNRLVGVTSITPNFGKRDLVISFPGQTEMVDKVSYNVDRGELQLVVTPKAGTPGLDPSKLKFVAGGAQADFALIVGTSTLSDLGKMYEEGKDYIDSLKHYFLTGANLSQETTSLMAELQLPLSQDAASNLLAGLEHATNMYQVPGVSADTFETAANLMRHGAKRQEVYAPAEVVPGSVPQSDNVTPKPQEDWYEPKVYKGTSLS